MGNRDHRFVNLNWMRGWASCCAIGFALACAPPEPARNLVFISLDTTRADHMSLYGYERETTPWMDSFFADGAVFENAVAQFNTTVPTHTSMFTGVYPSTHGNRRNTGFPEKFVTLAEILSREGFRTGAAVSGYPLKYQSCKLNRGFEAYSSRFKGIRRDGSVTIDHGARWLESLGPDERFFLFIHLYDAHGPYRENHHLESFQSEEPGASLEFVPAYQRKGRKGGEKLMSANAYVNRYDAQIRYQDELIEKLLAGVDKEKTLVLLTADHGETLVEREKEWHFNHGHNLFLEQTRIPLALRGPRVPAGRFDNIVETVDFLPTILELMDIEADGSLWEGATFAPLFEDPAVKLRDELAFSSSDSRPAVWKSKNYVLDRWRKTHALESRRWKLIRYPGVEGDILDLYNLESDPGETDPVTARYPDVAERMNAALTTWLKGAAEADAMPQDLESDLEALRALGYIN